MCIGWQGNSCCWCCRQVSQEAELLSPSVCLYIPHSLRTIELRYIRNHLLRFTSCKLRVDQEGNTQFPWWFPLIRTNKQAQDIRWGNRVCERDDPDATLHVLRLKSVFNLCWNWINRKKDRRRTKGSLGSRYLCIQHKITDVELADSNSESDAVKDNTSSAKSSLRSQVVQYTKNNPDKSKR